WMYRALSMLVESHHAQFIQDDLDYLTAAREQQHRLIDENDKVAQELSGEDFDMPESLPAVSPISPRSSVSLPGSSTTPPPSPAFVDSSDDSLTSPPAPSESLIVNA